MGQRWGMLLEAIRAAQDEDAETDRKVGKEIRNLLKDKNLNDLLEDLRRIQEELKNKDRLIQLLLEENERLELYQPDHVTFENKLERSEEAVVTCKDESQRTT